MKRTIAIGDIHGCSTALAALIEAIEPTGDDTIVPLGDYVDRGLDSKGVLDQLIGLQSRCRLIPILGNHDQMMLQARDSEYAFQFWLNCGGDSALDSYGSSSQIDLVPGDHFRFLETCRPSFQTDTHFFVHANYQTDQPICDFDESTLRWQSLVDHLPSRLHCSGKVAVVGHTPQAEVLDIGHLICLDTNACDGGRLTAMELPSKEIWQASESGEIRHFGLI